MSAPKRMRRMATAITLAITSGMKERVRNSKSSNSSASRHAGYRRVKVAARSRRRRHRPAALCALRRHGHELAHQRAERAARLNDRAFRAERPACADADRGRNRLQDGDFRLIRLRDSSTASIASGIPWPRIFSVPNLAIRPINNPPTTGIRITHNAQMVCPRAAEMPGILMIERDIRAKPDQIV